MNLSSRLGKLELLVQAQQPATPTFWTPERIERWRQWAVRLLESMPRERAEPAYAELISLPAERWGPITRRLDDMARRGADGIYDSTGWPHWAERAIALPEAVCDLLERHPDAEYIWDFSCQDCGLEAPHRSRHERLGSQDAYALMSVCPLCGGAVRYCGYTHRQYRETWERQKAELADGRA